MPHLGKNERKKNADEFVDGENMDLLVGNRTKQGEEKEAVKAYIAQLLKDTYSIEDVQAPERTTCCIMIDKEEIGSVGATGMHSRFFENVIAEVMECCGTYSEMKLRRALAASKMLSSDVSAAFDPNFPSVSEKNNTPFFGYGPAFFKYTGSRGKSGSNDASAEYIAQLRKLFDEEGIAFQMGELGKVDQGGGGTIAYIPAQMSMDVIDMGIPLHSMHAPFEIASKADIYEAYRAYKVFLTRV